MILVFALTHLVHQLKFYQQYYIRKLRRVIGGEGVGETQGSSVISCSKYKFKRQLDVHRKSQKKFESASTLAFWWWRSNTNSLSIWIKWAKRPKKSIQWLRKLFQAKASKKQPSMRLSSEWRREGTQRTGGGRQEPGWSGMMTSSRRGTGLLRGTGMSRSRNWLSCLLYLSTQCTSAWGKTWA